MAKSRKIAQPIDMLGNSIENCPTVNNKVSTEPQTLTTAQKAQVLTNLGIEMNNAGLGFLGIIEPGDPAPSTEKNGYYLSFAVNNERYPESQKYNQPYFNGATLNRYCMFIWTLQDGKWKFKRVKYEDHTRKDAIVIGRGLPIHYNEDGTYTLHLSPDGTMTRYAVCGFSPLRSGDLAYFDWGNKDNKNYDKVLFFGGARGGEKTKGKGYRVVTFLPDEDKKVFASKDELEEFIKGRTFLLEDGVFIQPASPNYKIVRDKSNDCSRVRWEPKIMTRPVFYKRVARNLNYFDAESQWASRKDQWRNWWTKWVMTQNIKNKGVPYRHQNGIIRASKRINNKVSRITTMGGVSDNCIIVNDVSTIYPTR